MTRLLSTLLLAASTLCAQKSVLGTLADFRTSSLEFGLKSDSGETVYFKVSPETQVVRIPPGERDLARSTPGAVTDLAIGDRLMVTFVEGMAEARRIVRITSGDIDRRNEAEKLDWQRRGIAGIVTATSADEVTLELRGMQGAQIIHIAIGPKTSIRRYAPDSVKFTDAQPSSLAAISPGDQLRARGDRTEDGSRLTAENIVFGTFRTIIGSITEVDPEKAEVHIVDLASKTPVIIRANADSRVKKMPDMRQMFAQMMKGQSHDSHSPQGPVGMAQMLEALPACTLDDLKPGSTLVVVGTKGARADAVTAILLVGNIDGMIQMAQSLPGGKELTPIEAMSRLHGGMMSGPAGFTLPAFIQ